MNADEAAPVREGDLLAGKYRVERVIGVGGMGVVVSARHVHLQTQVALKFLLPAAREQGEVVARFLREGQAAGRIRSEHVARVMDVGTFDDGAPYLVMEYLEGRDLGAELGSRGRLSVTEAVDYVLQALEALAEAHQLGIVHRDLKPSNLFLTRRADGSALIKVLDFGISKAISADASDSALTRTQGMMGSPLYMSPEQIRSAKHVDARSDIWSIGVILHELVTGSAPFTGDNVGGVLASIVADPAAPPSSLRPDLPPAIDAIIARCLAKSADGRYQNVAELALALGPLGSPHAAISVSRVAGVGGRGTLPSAGEIAPQPTAPTPAGVAAGTAAGWGTTHSPARKRTWLALIGAALLLVVVVGFWFGTRAAGEIAAEEEASVFAAAGSAKALPQSVPPQVPEPAPPASVVAAPIVASVALPSASATSPPPVKPATRRTVSQARAKPKGVVLPDDRN